MSRRYEELTTPEAVLAAFEAGRKVQFTACGDDYQMPIGQGGWIAAWGDEDSIRESFALIDGCRYRALIDEPEASAGPIEGDIRLHSGDALLYGVDPGYERNKNETSVSPGGTVAPDALPDDELPGMWSHSDTRGPETVRGPAIPEGFTPWAGGECPEDARGRPTHVFTLSGRSSEDSGPPIRGDAWCWRRDQGCSTVIAYRVESAQPWDCSNCGQRNSSWADECGRCETPRAGAQPAPSDISAAIARMDECRAGCDAGDPFYADVRAWDTIRPLLNSLGAREPAPPDVEALADRILRIFEERFPITFDALGQEHLSEVSQEIARRLRPQVDDAMVERFVDVYVPDLPDPRVAIRDALTAALNPEADNDK